MKKAVLISIKPEWCEKINSGEKTIEVRKTKPKLKLPFKCYIYMTAGNYQYRKDGWSTAVCTENGVYNGSQVVIGEFVCDTIITDKTYGHDALFNASACISEAEAARYCCNKEMYGWHISDLKIYDRPKSLKEFTRPCNYYHDCFPCIHAITDAETNEFSGCDNVVETAPQSWCYVEELV